MERGPNVMAAGAEAGAGPGSAMAGGGPLAMGQPMSLSDLAGPACGGRTTRLDK